MKMSYTTKTPKYQNKFESSTTKTTTTNTRKKSQLESITKTNSYLIQMSPSNQIINKNSLKNLYNKSNQLETKENFRYLIFCFSFWLHLDFIFYSFLKIK